MNIVSPMKNTSKLVQRTHSDSYNTGLKRSHKQKKLSSERTQARKNKRVRMAYDCL